MWSQVTEVLSEAFARLGRVLVADLPALVAMGIVLAGALLLAVLVRGLLRRSEWHIDPALLDRDRTGLKNLEDTDGPEDAES